MLLTMQRDPSGQRTRAGWTWTGAMPHAAARRLGRLALVPTLVASLASPGLGNLAAVAHAQPLGSAPQQGSQQANPRVGVGPFARGNVVALRGTQHQWVADEQGTLHWYADDASLANRMVDRSQRTEVTLEQIVTLPRGEPWMTLPMVKIGDAIYVPRRESATATPSLARVQSLTDLQLLGVDGDTFGRLVLERSPWEQRAGTSVDRLTRADLAALAPAGATITGGLAPGAWAPFTSKAGGFAVWAPSQALPAASGPAPGSPGQGLPPEAGIPNDLHIVLFGGYYDGPGSLYFAGSSSMPDDVRRQVEMLGADGVFETIRAELTRSEQVNLLAWRSITQGTNRGREFSFQPKPPAIDPFADLEDERGNPIDRVVPSVTVTGRVFIVGNKIFAVGVTTTPAAPPTGAAAASSDVARFLDSFKFLPS